MAPETANNAAVGGTFIPMLTLGIPGDAVTAVMIGALYIHIAKSQSPRLHRLAGAQNGRPVRFDQLVPAEMGKDFDGVFAHVAAAGYRGVNVTYPYKKRAAVKVVVDDPLVCAICAVNAVVFDEGGLPGFNSDYSGFVAAYRRVRGDATPGRV